MALTRFFYDCQLNTATLYARLFTCPIVIYLSFFTVMPPPLLPEMPDKSILE